ncbi:PDDEXK nuclease domain-containing protein [Chitinophaga japonensis]|uniref:Putative nuclease of restriction endonuclease-like (RecB) superfamily n=1 Tax=Chitinophaga japonensis TaxID=104662 RepID=A0A562SHU6_CHIJA|nr:PDDEXK nuclease domain-containing protein [Chitinophaga japonensis]TWI80875.1 putative nuclease of restriction endonuclease-like (RecB) superfamily [Chitinophaga japonensis]
MNFDLLLHSIEHTHQHLQETAAKAVNRLLTIRNWMIGYYIVEYEQKGEDRAKYGERLLEKIAGRLNKSSFSHRNLHLYRQFYLTYTHIGEVIQQYIPTQIWQSLIAKLSLTENQLLAIRQPVTDELDSNYLAVPPDKLVSKLSFTHIVQLLTIPDPLQRTFYELETIKCNWTVRELKRQINSLYFERMGLSKDKEKLQRMIRDITDNPLQPADFIKNVYTFEFLELPQQALVTETSLELALLNHLQDFLLEMGHGFCLEGRQKRILIGDEHFFIDLVFYHRILKCHVLVELKVDAFNHINAGQLNTYLNFYKAEMMQPDDNPPVGILMVTNKNDALVEYATAGMDQAVFVSRYAVKLPSKETLERFIRRELRLAPAT